ncbi:MULTISPECIES: acetamidase/formamidase family protein [unclassified Leucobacter]|uniref:acetamidase/formamidase family protein n=1 Tax=unclassified Leucobacter TaxID=2621730 RepID=UPI00165D498A|nr:MULTISPECIES: acetamidase/formamidase family protein [unclassified Leucobacter]MBC9935730.1 acetamidase/formamidase family protein [Leucobacter sp. cx-87]
MSFFLSKDQAHSGFSAEDSPALSLDPGTGERIVFETSDDAYAEYAATGSSRNLTSMVNPITGPVFVNGAEPGDTLIVTIVDIELGEYGWSGYFQGSGALAAVMGDEPYMRQIPIRDGEIHLTDTIRVPARPMVGCFGTAPAVGRNSSTAPVYAEGGNLDLTYATIGTRLYLPVRVAGAYLGLGDIHAVMAEGEASDVAVEAAGKITATVELTREFSVSAPVLETADEIIFVGLGDSLQESLAHGYQRAFRYLTRVHGFSRGDAFTVMSATVHSALGGPAGSAEAADGSDVAAGAVTTHHVPKFILPTQG